MEPILSLDGDGPLHLRLAEALRRQVLQGLMTPGTALPATRRLARDLGCARNTVIAAYDQLKAEGYVEARGGSAHRIAAALPPPQDAGSPASPVAAPLPAEETPGTVPAAAPLAAPLSTYGRRLSGGGLGGPLSLPAGPGRALRIDFRYGHPDLEAFPAAAWRRCVLAALDRGRRGPDRLGYQDPAGDPALRGILADHLRRTRGIDPRSREVIIVNGSQQGLDLALRVIADPGDRVAAEDPAYNGLAGSLEAQGYHLLPVPVDDQGLDPALLPAADVRLVCVTPSHQFPTGVVTPLRRRLDLLAWARAAGAWVLEDDYDREFRYSGPPVMALAGADQDGRVIHVGGFSKALFPSLRLGFLSVPAPLFPLLRDARRLADRHGPALEQRALALFFECGAFDRLLRRRRGQYAARRQALVDALAATFGNRVAVTGDQAGTHLVAWFPGLSVAAMEAWATRARDAGIGVQTVAPFFRGPPRSGMLLGFAGLSPDALTEGVGALATLAPPDQEQDPSPSG